MFNSVDLYNSFVLFLFGCGCLAWFVFIGLLWLMVVVLCVVIGLLVCVLCAWVGLGACWFVVLFGLCGYFIWHL